MECFQNALRRESRSRQVSCRILIPEFEGVLGRPDLVEARINSLPGSVELDVLAASLSSPANARILAALSNRPRCSQAQLETITGISNLSLRRYIRHLASVGMIKVHKNSAISLGCRLPWTMVNIVAYEGKLANWRRALHQAIGYRSFSHSVRVIMPEAAAERAKKLEHVFRNNGIGLISIDNDGARHIVIRSRNRRPASRRLYLMAAGMVLRQFLSERRRLHRRLRPECIQCI